MIDIGDLCIETVHLKIAAWTAEWLGSLLVALRSDGSISYLDLDADPLNELLEALAI